MKKFDEEEIDDDLDGVEEPNFMKVTARGTFVSRDTVKISNKGFSQEMVSKIVRNEIKIRKLKIKALKEEKKQVKEFIKNNPLTKGKKEGK